MNATQQESVMSEKTDMVNLSGEKKLTTSLSCDFHSDCLPDFIYSGKFFYKRTGEHYRRLELYLPAATGTYGEPLDATRDRFLSELSSGKRTARIAIYASGAINKTRYELVGGVIRSSQRLPETFKASKGASVPVSNVEHCTASATPQGKP